MTILIRPAQVDEAAELAALQVDPGNKRQGIGRRLMAVAFQRIVQDGFQSVALAVVRGNGAAIKFYSALGGRQAGGFTDPGPIWKSDNIIIKWNPVKSTGDEDR